MPLQFRSLEIGPHFPSPIYSSSSSQRSSLTSKFEKAFETIFKNERDCKETLRRYNFKKPYRKVGPSEQVSSISNFWSWRRKAEGWFATRTRSAITSRGAYSWSNSRKSPHSQQEAHEENKLASNDSKFAWEEGEDSPGW